MRRIIFIFLIFNIYSIQAQDISKQENEKASIEKEIAFIDKQLSTTRSKHRANMNTLALTQKKIEARTKLINQIDYQIQTIIKEISLAEQEISTLNRRLDTLEKHHEKLVYNAYKNRNPELWMMYVLASDGVNQAYRRWSYLKEISNSVRYQADEIKQTKIKLDIQKEGLVKLHDESLASRAEKKEEQERLNWEEIEVTNTIHYLAQEEKKILADLEQKRKRIEFLNNEIERILAEYVRAQKEGGGNVVIDHEISQKFTESKGHLRWPVSQGVIIERFGQSYHPVFKTIKLPFNNGIEISTQVGENAVSVFDGEVKQILIIPGYDISVLIQHGEYYTFYCKLNHVFVKKGDKIRRGSEVGSISPDENGTATIHFQVWKGTQKQNPEHWLSQNK